MTKISCLKSGIFNSILLFLFIGTLFIRTASCQNNFELQIVFTSNINGVLENCACGNPALGGLDYLSGTLAELRQKNPELIYVDGGDLFNSYSYPALNEAISAVYKMIKPDIFVPGDQEFIEGDAFFRKHVVQAGMPVFASNIQWTSGVIPKKMHTYPAGRQNVVFLSYLDSAAFEFISPPQGLRFDEHGFRVLYENTDREQFLFVVYHGPKKALNTFIKKYPAIDCLLLGHQQHTQIDLNCKPALIFGGEDGAFLMNLKLFCINGQFTLKAEKMAVTGSSVIDNSVQKIISGFNRSLKNKGGEDRRK